MCWAELSGSAELASKTLFTHQFSLQSALGWGTKRNYAGALAEAMEKLATPTVAKSSGEDGRRRADGNRHLLLYRDRGAGPSKDFDILGHQMLTRQDRIHPRARRLPLRTKSRARDRDDQPRSSRKSGHSAATSSGGGDHRHGPRLAPTPSARRDPGAAAAMARRRSATRKKIAAYCGSERGHLGGARQVLRQGAPQK